MLAPIVTAVLDVTGPELVGKAHSVVGVFEFWWT